MVPVGPVEAIPSTRHDNVVRGDSDRPPLDLGLDLTILSQMRARVQSRSEVLFLLLLFCSLLGHRP